MKNFTHKILVVLAFALVAAIDANAQSNLAGTDFATTLGQADATLVCGKQFGTYNGPRIFRDGVSAACPGKACPGNFGGAMFAYDFHELKNIVNTDVCITINTDHDACAAAAHCWVQYGPFVPPGDFCGDNPGFIGDEGSSVTGSFSVEIEGCRNFSVVWGNNFGVNNCTYSFNISPDPLLDLRCASEQVACIEKVTIGGNPTPTMTQWGLFLFGLIILTLGVVTIYNMSTSQVTERG